MSIPIFTENGSAVAQVDTVEEAQKYVDENPGAICQELGGDHLGLFNEKVLGMPPVVKAEPEPEPEPEPVAPVGPEAPAA